MPVIFSSAAVALAAPIPTCCPHLVMTSRIKAGTPCFSRMSPTMSMALKATASVLSVRLAIKAFWARSSVDTRVLITSRSMERTCQSGCLAVAR